MAFKIWNILDKNLSSVKQFIHEQTTNISNRTKYVVKNLLKWLITSKTTGRDMWKTLWKNLLSRCILVNLKVQLLRFSFTLTNRLRAWGRFFWIYFSLKTDLTTKGTTEKMENRFENLGKDIFLIVSIRCKRISGFHWKIPF